VRVVAIRQHRRHADAVRRDTAGRHSVSMTINAAGGDHWLAFYVVAAEAQGVGPQASRAAIRRHPQETFSPEGGVLPGRPGERMGGDMIGGMAERDAPWANRSRSRATNPLEAARRPCPELAFTLKDGLNIASRRRPGLDVEDYRAASCRSSSTRR